MELVSFIVFLISLCIIAYQDFKQRAISWWTLPLMLVAYLVYTIHPMDEIWNSFGFNVLFVLLNLLAITVYFSVKASSLVNVVDTKIGLGDILFMLVSCAMFSIPNFVLFFILSLVVSVVFAILAKLFTKETQIPLAGIMAILLIGVCTSSYFMSYELTRNSDWLNTLLL